MELISVEINKLGGWIVGLGQVKVTNGCFIKAGRIGIGGKIKNFGLQQATGEFIAFMDSRITGARYQVQHFYHSDTSNTDVLPVTWYSL